MSGIECAFFGSLTRDAEAKTSKGGKSYLRMNVRVETGDAAQFVGVTCFDEKAIALVDKLVKGARVYIEGGGLRLDEWAGQDGVMRRGLSCMSWHCRLAEIGKNKPRRPQPTTEKQSDAAPNTFHSDDIPW
jgi:single-stranded DNA-binding protein